MSTSKRTLPHLLKAPKELPFPNSHCIDEKGQSVSTLSKLDLAIAAAKYKHPKPWSTFPCSLWLETSTTVKVNCVNCEYEREREWQGVIIGKGIHGFVSVLIASIKHSRKSPKSSKPFIGMLTVCVDCYGVLDFWDDAINLDQIIKNTSGSIILGLSEKEIEEVVSSRGIIMEGVLMNVIKTVGVDGKWRERPILTPVFKN